MRNVKRKMEKIKSGHSAAHQYLTDLKNIHSKKEKLFAYYIECENEFTPVAADLILWWDRHLELEGSPECESSVVVVVCQSAP